MASSTAAEHTVNGSATDSGSDPQPATDLQPQSDPQQLSEPQSTSDTLADDSEPSPQLPPPQSDIAQSETSGDKKWPGWPGDNVFRIIIPVLKVGSIIGRKGELIKKMCEETRARIRVLEGAVGTPDRVVSSDFRAVLSKFESFLFCLY